MRIALGSDHAGYRYKQLVAERLRALGHDVVDFGTNSDESVDYPLFIRPACEAVANGDCERAIIFGGSGNGEAMVANRITGVRAAVVWSPRASLACTTMPTSCRSASASSMKHCSPSCSTSSSTRSSRPAATSAASSRSTSSPSSSGDAAAPPRSAIR